MQWSRYSYSAPVRTVPKFPTLATFQALILLPCKILRKTLLLSLSVNCQTHVYVHSLSRCDHEGCQHNAIKLFFVVN